MGKKIVKFTHIILCQPGKLPLKHHHPEAKEEHDEAMAKITKHHREQEWKCDDSVWS